MLSHLGFCHTARHYERGFGYVPEDRMLLAVIVVMVQVGGCTVSLRQFQAADTLREIEARRITATLLVPAMFNLCLMQPDLASLDL